MTARRLWYEWMSVVSLIAVGIVLPDSFFLGRS
jgi:hypothetical protein